jgi:hypothetical protein
MIALRLLVFELIAASVQVFDYEANDRGFDWARKTNDGSAVVGEVIAKADAPEPGAIQWLLLGVEGHEGLAILSAAASV